MAKLKNIIEKTLKNNSNFDNALDAISRIQKNILKNYSNSAFDTDNKNKLLNLYNNLSNIGKSIYHQKTLADNNLNMDDNILRGGISNVKYIWRSENGPHTCEVCQALDGTVFDFEDEVPERPHPNCKCYVEIVEDEQCECMEKAENLIQEAEDLEVEFLSIIDEIKNMSNDINAEYDRYIQLYNMALSMIEDMENMQSCGNNCIVNKNFKIQLPNYSELKEIVLNFVKTHEILAKPMEIFEYNKQLMIDEREHIDKYYHAKANCETSRLGFLQECIAELYSILKEVDDFKYKVFEQHRDAKVIFFDCLEDLLADILGILAAYQHGYCGDNVEKVEEFFKNKQR